LVVITIDSKPLPVETRTPATPQTSALGALTNLKPEALAAAATSAAVTAGGYAGPVPPPPNADGTRPSPSI